MTAPLGREDHAFGGGSQSLLETFPELQPLLAANMFTG